MADTRIEELIQRLYQQTMSRKIKWDKTVDKAAFQTAFPTYAIRISARHGLTETVYDLTIYDKEGDIIENVHTDTWEQDKSPILSLNSGNSLAELYGEARRQALDVDQALNSLLETLSKR